MKKYIGIGVIVVIIIVIGYSILKDKVGSSNDGKLSRSDLEQSLDRAYDDLAQADDKIKLLEQQLQVLSGGDSKVIDSIDVSDGNGLNSVGGKVIFPSEFKYPEVEQAANESSINLSSKIKVTPSLNWVVSMGGTKTDYVHPSGVRGTITLGNAKTMYKTEDLTNTLNNFLNSIKATNVINGKVFLNGTERGVESKVNIIIDNRPYKARIGTLGYNGQVITFMFYYEGDTDANKDELITSLLNSIKVGEQVLSIN